MFVDYGVRVLRSDKNAYDAKNPYQVVQVWPMRRYPAAPFKTDNEFREAFRRAANKLGVVKLESWVKPPVTFLKAVYQCYR